MLRLVRMTVAALVVPGLVLCLSTASGAAQRFRAATRPSVQSARASAPTPGALYTDGPDGRYLLGGQWLFRLDPSNRGLSSGFASEASRSGWSTVSVPNAWNATDQTQASMSGSIGWYRRDFRLPDASPTLAWIVRFESVNFRAQVWLNGRVIGANVGAYLPFELQLGKLARRAVNRLVIRVDNRLAAPLAGGPPVTRPQPPNGWWNYGGLLGEVYLRRVDRVGFEHVTIRPRLACAACRAQIDEQATVRNYTAVPQIVHLAGVYGPLSIDLGTHTIAAGQDAAFAASATLAHPRLWSPAHPNLYTARLVASAQAVTTRPNAGRTGSGSPAQTPTGASTPTLAARYTILSGVRSILVNRAGQLVLNGQPVHWRGVSVHEDNLVRGGALNNSDRAQMIARARDLGATLIRSHHPLHPELEELADRAGILLWSEIPVYQVGEAQLGDSGFTDYARAQLQANVLTNENHPSVAVWSVGNELPTVPGPAQTAYIASQAALAKQLDPTRPVGLPVQVSRSIAECQSAAYAPLDVLGINDYFGWYTGPDGSIADRDALSSYLDSVRACYPRKAVAITEFGAEANRHGPVEEKGTYAFQSSFVAFHLSVYGSKSWLAGATYFTLQEFRVRPGWDGGNPYASPPLHQKGLISFAGVPKPAYYRARALFRRTRQYG